MIQWVVAQADAARWTYAGRAEVFCADTQIEGFGPTFAAAKINDHGDRALSWQTLWFGPFLLAGQLGSPGDVSAALSPWLQQHRKFWAERPAISWPTAARAARRRCGTWTRRAARIGA